jgi:hypothetical protein
MDEISGMVAREHMMHDKKSDYSGLKRSNKEDRQP